MSNTKTLTQIAVLTALAAIASPANAQVFTGPASTHSCGVLNDNTIKCWGEGANGRLGSGATSAIGDAAGELGDSWAPVDLDSVAVSGPACTGNKQTCVIRSDNKLFCFGRSEYGQLGFGTITYSSESSIGDNSLEMGSALREVLLGTGVHAVSLACGDGMTGAVLSNGAIKTWGWGGDGATGAGLGSVQIGADDADMGDNLAEINLGVGRTAQKLVMAWTHSCALLNGGSVKCFGSNADGRLGQGHTTTVGVTAGSMNSLQVINMGGGNQTVGAKDVAVGRDHTCILRGDNQVVCVGANAYGQLGTGDTSVRGSTAGNSGNNLNAVDLGGANATKIVAGDYYTCALLTTGGVRCWGRGTDGRLGSGATANIGDAAGETASIVDVNIGTPSTAVNLSGGLAHVCATRSDLSVVCWGLGTVGRLGRGSTTSAGATAVTMGSALVPVNFGTGLSVNAGTPTPAPTATITSAPTTRNPTAAPTGFCSVAIAAGCCL